MGNEAAVAKDTVATTGPAAAPAKGADNEKAVNDARSNVDPQCVGAVLDLVAPGGVFSPNDANIQKAKTNTFKLVFEPGKANLQSLFAYLALVESAKPVQSALLDVDAHMTTDRELIKTIETACAKFLGGGPIGEATGVCMVAYPKLTTTARRFLQGRQIVKDLKAYNKPANDISSDFSSDGKAHESPADALYKLVHGDMSGVLSLQGSIGLPPKVVNAQPTPEQLAQFTQLKARVLREIPAPEAGKQAPNAWDQKKAVDQTVFAALQKAIHDADARVRDLLAEDAEVQGRLVSALGVDQLKALSRTLDSVEGLVEQCFPPPSADGKPAPVPDRFAILRDYLAARPGPSFVALRLRVASNTQLAPIIAALNGEQKSIMMRLIARGVADPEPQDTIYAATRGEATANQALAAATELVGTTTKLHELRGDIMFRNALDHAELKKKADVQGLQISVSDYIHRAWGETPGAASDPAGNTPAIVNPGTTEEETAPPTPDEWKHLNAIVDGAVSTLAPLLKSSWYSADAWTSDSSVVNALTAYERKCAEDWVKKIFRRANIAPGAELVKRANAHADIGDIRTKLHKCLGETGRQTAERVLGLRPDSAAIGQVGGQVKVAHEDKVGNGKGKVPLQQALAEVTIQNGAKLATKEVPSGATLAQLVRLAAEDMARELDEISADKEDVETIQRNYQAAFAPKIPDLAKATDVKPEAIFPIEFLRNAFREVPDGGDLRTKIEKAFSKNGKQLVADLELDEKSDEKRAKGSEPEAPPDERFKAPGEKLWQAIAAYSAPAQTGAETTNLELAGAKPVKDAFTAAIAVPAVVPKAAEPKKDPISTPVGGMSVAPKPEAPKTASTMTEWYHQKYGIDPERHVIELARASFYAIVSAIRQSNTEQGEWKTKTPEPKIDGFGAQFGLADGKVNMAIAKVEDAALKADGVTDVDRTAARTVAKKLWDGLHASSDVGKLRLELQHLRRPQQLLVLAAFRELSGGIEFEFYVQQAVNGGGKSIGGEGVGDRKEIGNTNASISGDKDAMNEVLAIAQTGTVGFLVRIDSALNNPNIDELFKLLDDATLEERKALLGDGPRMNKLRARCGEHDFDRVYGVIAGTADLTTKLYARGKGEKVWAGTDVDGMKTDVKNHAKQRFEFYIKERKEGRTQMTDEQIKAAVKVDMQKAFSDPALKALIDDECNNWWDSKGESVDMSQQILNGGEESKTGKILDNYGGIIWSNDILEQINAMSAEERGKLRGDPEFLRRLHEVSMDPYKRARIMQALGALNAGGEENHITALNEALIDYDVEKILDALAHMTQAEHKKVTSDPTLVAKILERVQVRGGQPALERARRMLAFNPTEAKTGIVGSNFGKDPVPGEIDQAEKERLAFLQHQARSCIESGAYKSWSQLVKEGVVVFKMDFKPRAQQAPGLSNAPAGGPANESHEDAVKRLNQPTVGEKHATEMRDVVWKQVEPMVREAAKKWASDGVGENQIDKKFGGEDGMVKSIMGGVLGTRDPSIDLVHMFSGNSTWGTEEDEVKGAIKGASDQLLVDQWASVMHPGHEGGLSLYEVYHQYRAVKDSPPESAKESAEGRKKLIDDRRIAFQRYVLQPSTSFENQVIMGTAGWLTSKDDASVAKTKTPEQNEKRDNKKYAEYRNLMHERIKALDMTLVARKIGAEGPDAAVLTSGIRTAEQGLAVAKEQHGQQTSSGSTSFTEKRILDRALGDYHQAVNDAEDKTKGTPRSEDGAFQDIPEDDQKKIAKIDSDFSKAKGDYVQARDKAAEMAATVVGAVIGVALTALLPGPGTVAAMALYGAMVSAAAATGQVLTKEAILGNQYDASGEGLKTIAVAAVSGAVAGGAQFYSGQVVNALAPMGPGGTALAQAQALAQGTSVTAPAWRQLLQEGMKGAGTASITGLANTAGSMIDPTIWLHGWNEGFYKARDKGMAEIRKLPGDAVRMALVSMAGAAASKAANKAGLKGPDPVAPGEIIGAKNVAAQLKADLPNYVVSGAADTLLQGNFQSPSEFFRALTMAVASNAQGVGQGMQGAALGHSIETNQKDLHAAREIGARLTSFVSVEECKMFHASVNAADASALPSASQFLNARDLIAGSAVKVSLTDAQAVAFKKWVREAKTPAEFESRMKRNPLELGEVSNADSHAAAAKQPLPQAKTPGGQAAGKHADSAKDAFDRARQASDSAALAEERFVAMPTGPVAAEIAGTINEALKRANAAKADIDQAVEDLEGLMKSSHPPEDEKEIKAALDRAKQQQAEVEAKRVLIVLGKARVTTDLAATGKPAATGSATPPLEPSKQPEASKPPPINDATLSAQDYALYHQLIKDHGPEKGAEKFREIVEKKAKAQGGGDITASMVQGSDFVADKKTAFASKDLLLTAVGREVPTLNKDVPGIESITAAGDHFLVTMIGGRTFKLRVTAETLTPDILARSKANTERGIHNVQLNEAISEPNLRRALAHEVAELAAIDRNAMAGLLSPPVMLKPGKFEAGPLAPHDSGRIAELNVLSAQHAQAQAAGNTQEVLRTRSEIGALVDRLGLRAGTDGAAERFALIKPLLTPEAQARLQDLARPVGSLDKSDQDAHAAFEKKSKEQEDLAKQAEERAKQAKVEHPPGQQDDGRLSEAQVNQLNTDALKRRLAKHDATEKHIDTLQPAAGEKYARVPKEWLVQIGGGAAAAGLTANTFFIDPMGRWHVDSGDKIAQTAGQLGDIPGLGDANLFATANGRVDLKAIRYMINNRAADAHVLNGMASFEQDGTMLVLKIIVHDHEGNPKKTVRLLMNDGNPPVIAAGFSMEVSPRNRPAGEDPVASVNKLRKALKDKGIYNEQLPADLKDNFGETDAKAAAWSRALDRPAPAPHSDKTLRQLIADAANDPNVKETLESAKVWEEQRELHGPNTKNPTLLRGDEANQTDYTKHPNTLWVIGGAGGTAISAAEIILKQTSPATRKEQGLPDPVKVIIVGKNVSDTLAENTQWKELERKYGENGENRLEIQEAELGRLKPDGKGGFIIQGKNGEIHTTGYISALGRDARVPSMLQPIVYEAQDKGRPVTGELIFDKIDNQYLGYKLFVGTTTDPNGPKLEFHVTGAASRAIPGPPIFSEADVKKVNGEGSETAQKDAPKGAGIFGGGFSASANQANRYSDWREKELGGTQEKKSDNDLQKSP